MPAKRVDQSVNEIPRMAVVGQDSADRHLVQHVGMATDHQRVTKTQSKVTVQDMQPPLRRGGQMDAHVYGQCELSDDDANAIKVFIDEHLPEREAQQRRRDGYRSYIVRPHAEWHCEDDGTPIFRRFSCAGFVIEAYGDAEIHLLKTEEADLPEMELSDLEIAYPDLQRIEQIGITLEYIGLDGAGPWGVVMPGYLFHSLARDASAIRAAPYQAVKGDERFPSEH